MLIRVDAVEAGLAAAAAMASSFSFFWASSASMSAIFFRRFASLAPTGISSNSRTFILLLLFDPDLGVSGSGVMGERPIMELMRCGFEIGDLRSELDRGIRPWGDERMGVVLMSIFLAKLRDLMTELDGWFLLFRTVSDDFWIISALNAADLGLLLMVKCLVDSGICPSTAFNEDLFKY